MKHSSIARRGAAAVAATALALSASMVLAPAADAKPKPKPLKGSTTGTVLFNCDFSGTPFEYNATIKLSGVRKTKTTKPVKLTATMSDLPGVAPLALDFDATEKLDVTVGTVDTVLTGAGHLKTGAAYEPAPHVPRQGLGQHQQQLAADHRERPGGRGARQRDRLHPRRGPGRSRHPHAQEVAAPPQQARHADSAWRACCGDKTTPGRIQRM